MQKSLRSALLFIIGILTTVSTAQAGEKDGLDAALVQRAPEIVKHLRDKNYKNVGVLKFLVKKGDEAPNDNIGPLNLSMARRLEVALVLSSPDDKLGIIRNASQAVADSKRRASHLSTAGRKELFEVPYVLAWGADNEPVKADAFLTGVVQISPDLETTNVQIQAVGKDQSELTDVCRFSVPTDARTLTEAGGSYSLRQISSAKEDAPARAAQQTEQGKAKHPLETAELKWDIYYDTEPVPLTIKNGRASIKGPKQGQAVWFVLTNKGKERHAAVLRVNGENTLYREKLPSSLCRKWILDPGDRVIVKGYQSDDKTAAAFQVLSPEESEQEEVNYGEHAGTFSLEVFAGRTEAPPVAAANPKVKAVEAGELPTSKPIKLASLQQKLMEEHRAGAKVSDGHRQISGGNTSRLVVPGKPIDSPVDRVTFDPAPVPIVSATVRYYTSGK